MIQVQVIRSTDGMLRSCVAEGHAGFSAKGQDIVCAGVTVLLRTVLSLLESSSSVRVVADAPKRGILAFRVLEYDKAETALLVHCGDFLETGLSSLSNDYPNHVSLRVQTE